MTEQRCFGSSFPRRAFLQAAAGGVGLGVLGALALDMPSSAQAATMTVDFGQFPIKFDHMNWQLRTVHSRVGSTTTGFRYESGTGSGQRTDQHGVTWPTQAYYNTALGSGGFTAVDGWPMKAMTLYAVEKSGSWRDYGWKPYQDLAEGATCVDDSARTAIALATDYLLNGTESSIQSARAVLTFTCYMTSVEGKVYNFAWLDAPEMFSWDPMQSQDKHYMYRSEFLRRTQYPPLGEGDSKAAWMQFDSDSAHIVTSAGSPVRADPFISHPKYSIAMDDLRAVNNSDVAPVYNGPLYSGPTGAPSSYVNNIKKDWTTSTHELGADDARQFWALALGLQMMQKRKTVIGSWTVDETYFAKFLENHANRVLRNIAGADLSALDNRLAANFLIGLCEYYKALWVGGGWGAYGSLLPQTGLNAGGTGSVYDDPTPQSTIYAKIDEGINAITARQYTSSDWRTGIFIDNSTAGNWQAWGQLQIYALSKAYRLKRDIGQSAAALDGFLDIISYSADNFYGNEAYHYRDASNNYARTKERITSISCWNARFHTNSSQTVYENSSIVAGLLELAMAWNQSARSNKAAKAAEYLGYAKIVASWFIGNNSALVPMYAGNAGALPFDGRGSVLDAINVTADVASRSGDAGGESTAEGLWAMILIKKAISQYGLGNTFDFTV